MSFLLILCAFCMSGAWSLRARPPYALEDAELHFENFIQEHSKQYADENEKQARFQIFKKSLEEVNRLNEGQDDAVFGLTFFMDLTQEEFLRSYTGLGQNETVPLAGRTHPCAYISEDDIEDVAVPDSFDWRQQNVVSPVKQQMSCGSCYAFSALGNIESQYAIKYGQYLDLSEQQIVDCDRTNGGCGSGHMTNAFRYLIETGGSVGENDYPYRNIQGRCRFNRRNVKAKVADCHSFCLQSQEKVKQLLYSYGPISIAIQSSGIRTYTGGLIKDETCDVGCVNHAVLLVGYGTRNGVPIWIAKNSWGTKWGDQGYLYMTRGDNVRSCGMMNNYMSAAIIP